MGTRRVQGEVLVSGDPSAGEVLGCGWQLVPFERVLGRVVLLARSCEGKVRDGESTT